MLSSSQLASMRSADIKGSVLPDLADISTLHVNCGLPVNERIAQFISEVGNPYLFRVNDTIVKVQYSHESITLQDRLSRMIHE